MPRHLAVPVRPDEQRAALLPFVNDAVFSVVYILSIVPAVFAPFLYNSVMSSFQVNLCVSAALCTWPNLVLSSSSESTQTADVLAIDGPVLN